MKTLQQKAIAFDFLLILGKNSHQVSKVVRMHLSGQAALASPHSLFHSLNAEYSEIINVEMVNFKAIISLVRAPMQTSSDNKSPGS